MQSKKIEIWYLLNNKLITHGNYHILSHFQGHYYRRMDVREKNLINSINKSFIYKLFPLLMDLFYPRGLGMWVLGLPNSSVNTVERLLL